MLAMNYRGPLRVRIDHKPVPKIEHPQDAVVRVTRSCICGSDLHLYNGSVPDTRPGMALRRGSRHRHRRGRVPARLRAYLRALRGV